MLQVAILLSEFFLFVTSHVSTDKNLSEFGGFRTWGCRVMDTQPVLAMISRGRVKHLKII